jgi:hypothetical protein
MKISLVSLLIILFTGIGLFAQIPRTISYQGVLTDPAGNPKPDGDYVITFSLYEEANSGVNAIWIETKTLNVTKGLFSTSLGDQTQFGANVEFDKPYWLGIKVGNEAELTPRIALTSSGYSFSSINSDTAKNIVNGKVVKSLNGLKDAVTLEGSGGTTINTNGNTITISSSGSGGTGIQGIQNTNNTIDVSDPNGPTATVNVKVPLHLSGGSSDEILRVENTQIDGNGIEVMSAGPIAIYAQTSYGSGTGVYGEGSSYGIFGNSTDGEGAIGLSVNSFGVFGKSDYSRGVLGYSTSGTGVYGETNSGYYGIYGYSPAGVGVGGESSGYGLLGKGHGDFGVGVYATSDNWYAGSFQGNVEVTGTLSKGGGSFKIDHPLDPSNKYLSHSFVESPDMMNIYNGNVTTDVNGTATIILPEWFEALNKDFRYQLTVVGQQAQAWVESKIQNNHFTLRTDKPDVEVSWQVTGIRKDAFAEKNRIPVEELKSEKDRGKYLHPELYGQPKEMGIHYVKVPEIKHESNSNIPLIDSPKMQVPILEKEVEK